MENLEMEEFFKFFIKAGYWGILAKNLHINFRMFLVMVLYTKRL